MATGNHVFVAGEVLTAAQMNSVGGVMAHVTQSAGASIVDGDPVIDLPGLTSTVTMESSHLYGLEVAGLYISLSTVTADTHQIYLDIYNNTDASAHQFWLYAYKASATGPTAMFAAGKLFVTGLAGSKSFKVRAISTSTGTLGTHTLFDTDATLTITDLGLAP